MALELGVPGGQALYEPLGSELEALGAVEGQAGRGGRRPGFQGHLWEQYNVQAW